jgi:hypothetical protein
MLSAIRSLRHCWRFEKSFAPSWGDQPQQSALRVAALRGIDAFESRGSRPAGSFGT